MKFQRLFVSILILAVLAACSPASRPAPAASTDPAPGRVLWTYATEGEIWSSPAVAEGAVYFGSDDHAVYAVSLKTHQLNWKFETGDIVRSRPAVANGQVYFSSDDGYLFAVNARTGKQAWKLDMGRPLAPRKPVPQGWDYMQSSPTVADGMVYSGTSNQNFYAVDARTGKVKWQTRVGLYVRSTPAVVDGVVYFGDWLGTLYALDAKTGAARWTFNTYGPVIPSPTVVDGVVYIGSKFPCLYAIDAATGQQKWCFKYPASIPWVESSAAVADGVVYVGSSDWDKVNAVDAATGELKWDFTTQGDPWSSPAVADGVVYVGATGGGLYALDAATGSELWMVPTGAPLKTVDTRFVNGIVSSPAVADGVVYFGSLDGKLYAVSSK
ncbi:MAG TPA: PQQ-binding-like beta-propeller repeat protein [Anaerolineales bacterium]|nr:PQQ-binding-like beta-propeller repeat protein [Anaerolineales bacterium]